MLERMSTVRVKYCSLVTIKFTPKNQRDIVEYPGFISQQKHNHCQIFSFSRSPREKLMNRQSNGVLQAKTTCNMETDQLQCGNSSTEVSLSSLTFTLQSHCSSINLKHPAIWSPSSHSDTQTPLTGIDLTHTVPCTIQGPARDITPVYLIVQTYTHLCTHVIFLLVKQIQCTHVNQRGGVTQ